MAARTAICPECHKRIDVVLRAGERVLKKHSWRTTRTGASQCPGSLKPATGL